MTNISKDATMPIGKSVAAFATAMLSTAILCLSAYTLAVDSHVQRSEIPSSYKWFLLKNVPGPRIIFESGSNSHHAIDTDMLGKALGMTAINIADNGGYALEDKITRLETHARPGDIVVLPLEWIFYHREKLTDNYVETLFDSNRDYYQTMPLIKKVQRALSLPPEKVITQFGAKNSDSAKDRESPARELFASALKNPSGHQSSDTPSGPEEGVAEQSCDDYVLGTASERQNLKLGKNIKPALARLKALKKRDVNIHFAWPVLAGDGCLSASPYVTGFRAQIEHAVNAAGFEFLGTPSQSLYPQRLQDNTPYHVITQGAAIHTRQMIGFLNAQGYGGKAAPLDLKTFARHRLLEIELAQAEHNSPQTPLTLEAKLSMDNPMSKRQVEFTAGWWDFEPYGRWMRDTRAMFRVTLPNDTPREAVLQIQGITKSGRLERVTVLSKGQVIASGMFGRNTSLMVPVANLPQGEALSLFIELPDTGQPQSPQDLGEGNDARTMTLHIQSVKLTTTLTADQNKPVSNQGLNARDQYSAQNASDSSQVDGTALQAQDLRRTLLNNTGAQASVLAPLEPIESIDSMDNSIEPKETVDVKGRASSANSLAPKKPASTPSPNVEPIKAFERVQPEILSSDIPSNADYGDGWWPQEVEGRWMMGHEASFSLSVPESAEISRNTTLSLRLRGDFFLGRAQPMQISIQGGTSQKVKATPDGIMTVSFEIVDPVKDITVNLLLPKQELSTPEQAGLSDDTRVLTYFLKSIELSPI